MPPWVAAGNPLPDVEGFRRSHQQAQEAHAVAIASGANARRVTAASDPGLAAAALMGSNLDTARVWVAEVLGPLASCTENDERLRETLGVFLRTGGSFKAAAEELHLHYELRQISRAARDRPPWPTDQRWPTRHRSRVASLPLVRQRRTHDE